MASGRSVLEDFFALLTHRVSIKDATDMNSVAQWVNNWSVLLNKNIKRCFFSRMDPVMRSRMFLYNDFLDCVWSLAASLDSFRHEADKSRCCQFNREECRSKRGLSHCCNASQIIPAAASH